MPDLIIAIVLVAWIVVSKVIEAQKRACQDKYETARTLANIRRMGPAQ